MLQPFTFKHGTTAVKGTKSTQLYRAAGKNANGCDIGASYTYQVSSATASAACHPPGWVTRL